MSKFETPKTEQIFVFLAVVQSRGYDENVSLVNLVSSVVANYSNHATKGDFQNSLCLVPKNSSGGKCTHCIQRLLKNIKRRH